MQAVNMKYFLSLLFLFFSAYFTAFGQVFFEEGYQKVNPVPKGNTFSTDQKIEIHQHFLQNASAEKDTLKQLYGNLYLFFDCARTAKYTEAATFILEAESLAKASGNSGWEGWTLQQKGLFYVELKKYKEALSYYEAAAKLCGEAKDSLCVAESMEQISAMYGVLGGGAKSTVLF